MKTNIRNTNKSEVIKLKACCMILFCSVLLPHPVRAQGTLTYQRGWQDLALNPVVGLN